jgi:hypothetical protein
VRINTPQISHQTIDGEVVAINLENGCYYSLLDLSASIWHQLAGGVSRAAILDAVTRAYPSHPDASEQVSTFIDQLLADGLVVEEGAEAVAAPAVALPDAFTAPKLEKFTDMQELLMLDPIHEVDSMGWPHKPAGS